jgi:hypothetical protein
MTEDQALASLLIHTRPGSRMRGLGLTLLSLRSMTTAEIIRHVPMCSSVFDQLRRTLRGTCGWQIETTPLENSNGAVYRVVLDEEEGA